MNWAFLHNPMFAHAFGQTYNLPVPLWLFLFGGAAAVILSFVIATFFINIKQANASYPEHLVGSIPTKVINIGRLLTLIAYFWVIVAGIVGVQSFRDNIGPTLFWVLFLVGFAHLTILIGNVWQLVNPFQALLNWLERFSGKKLEPRYPYPAQLGYFPALAFYFGFVWLELLSYGWGIVPLNLSKILLGYGMITIIGALLYGKEKWFQYGDFFSVFFGVFGRIAAIKYEGNKVYLRPPFVGLLDKTKHSVSLLLFVLFMLSSTAFDGLRETATYISITDFIAKLPVISAFTSRAVDTLVLLISPFIFLSIYWAFMWVMKQLVKTSYSVTDLAMKFSFTLVPIAIAYNVAHYFTLLLIQGQLSLKLISDPLGLGWNLFHTIGYNINAGVINAASVWYIQISLIIVGHIAAVYLAHVVALRTFGDTKKAVLSQYPMLALMVTYTMTSLWIISQAIVSK